MAAHVQAPDIALLERERVVRAIRAHEVDLRALGVTRLWLPSVGLGSRTGQNSSAQVLVQGRYGLFRASGEVRRGAARAGSGRGGSETS